LGNPEGVVLDDEVMAHSRPAYFDGHALQLMSSEDMIHSKLLVTWKRERQEDFQDILLIIENAKSLDWERLLDLTSRYPERLLALLSYAVSYQATEELLPPSIVNKIEIFSLTLSEWTERTGKAA
jgi:hypothetical protein